MNFSKIIIVSFILLTVMIGCVSASEDINTDDSSNILNEGIITVDEAGEDISSNIDDAKDTINNEENADYSNIITIDSNTNEEDFENNKLKKSSLESDSLSTDAKDPEMEVGNFHDTIIQYYSQINTTVKFKKIVSGDIRVYFDGKLLKEETITHSQKGIEIHLSNEINSIQGLHNLTFMYLPRFDDYESVSKEYEINVTDLVLGIPEEIYIDENTDLYAEFFSNTTGNLTLYIDGIENQKIALKNTGKNNTFRYNIDIGFLNAKTEPYTIKLVYEGNYGTVTKEVKTYVKYNVKINLDDEISYGYETPMTILFPNGATGNVTIFVDNGNTQTKKIEDGEVSFNLSNLDMGIHTLKVHYEGNDKYNEMDLEKEFKVIAKILFPKTPKDEDGFYELIHTLQEDWNVSIILPSDANGKLVVVYDIDFKKYYEYQIGEIANLENGAAKIDISDLKLGYNYLSAMYESENNDYSVESLHIYELIVKPKITYPQHIVANNVSYIKFELLPDATGSLLVDIDGEKYTTNLDKGKANIALHDLKPGKHKITLNYTDSKYGEYSTSWTFQVEGVKPKITGKNMSMIYTDGSTFKVTVYGKDGKIAKGVNVTFRVNGKKYKTIKTDSKGVATLKLNLTPKTYKITATSFGVTITRKLTVKQILTLKTVKVKKFAKKLVLTASLKKVKGKYLKGKVITFKFNGKTYKAKTNAKGVAKVTIKKRTLKKLKVGKKIKYQASYVKTTIKKTAKVSK